AAGQPRIRGNVVNVQLEGVGAGLFNLPSIGDPASRRDAVETADDRNIHGGLGAAHMLEVGIGTEVVARHVWKVSGCLRIALRPEREIAVQVMTLEVDLLLEQRVEDYGSRPRVFHSADVVEGFAQRRGRRGEMIPERE